MKTVDELDPTNLDELGNHRRLLLAQLAALKPLLDAAVIAERKNNATWADLVTRSSYGGIEQVKQVYDPSRREAMNAERKKPDKPTKKSSTG